MRAVKYHLSLVLIASILVSCDLFFPYTLEDAPSAQVTQVPEGGFSVSRSRFVYFSSGNLQYHGGMDKWRFAPNQYDYIGEANCYIAPDCDYWIDLFGWGTGDYPTKKSKYADDSSMFMDWGINQIGNDEEGTWRTLTYKEWEYILEKRENASSLQGLAYVADVNGFILLPDNWKCPSGVTFKPGYSTGFSTNVYSVSKWQQMEEAGAVFLPAAGFREGSTVYDVQSYGHYWSATKAELLEFSSNKAYMVDWRYDYLFQGRSVRLVKDL